MNALFLVLIAFGVLALAYLHSNGVVNALRASALVLLNVADAMESRFQRRGAILNEALMRKLEASR